MNNLNKTLYIECCEVRPTDYHCVDIKKNLAPIFTYKSSPTTTKQVLPLVCHNRPLFHFYARILIL